MVAVGEVRQKAQAIERNLENKARSAVKNTSKAVKGAAARVERRVSEAAETVVGIERDTARTVMKVEKMVEEKIMEEKSMVAAYIGRLWNWVKAVPTKAYIGVATALSTLLAPLSLLLCAGVRAIEGVFSLCAYFWSLLMSIDKTASIPSMPDLRLSLPSLSFPTFSTSMHDLRMMYTIPSWTSDDERVRLLEAEISKLRSELAATSTDVKGLKKELLVFQTNCKAHCEKLRAAEETNTSLNLEVTEKKTLIQNLCADLTMATDAMEKTQEQKEALEREVSARLEQVNLLEAEIMG